MDLKILFFILAVSMTTAVVAGVQTGLTHANSVVRGQKQSQMKEKTSKRSQRNSLVKEIISYGGIAVISLLFIMALDNENRMSYLNKMPKCTSLRKV